MHIDGYKNGRNLAKGKREWCMEGNNVKANKKVYSVFCYSIAFKTNKGI